MGGGNPYLLDSPTALTPFPANVAYHDTMADLSFEAGSGFGDFHMFGSSDFTAINGGAAPGTVSPKDLVADSIPPSTTFTNLTTPGSTYLETPGSYEASPLLNDNYTYDTGSFFQELDALMPQPMNRTVSGSSISQVLVHPGGPAHNRKRSVAVAAQSPALRPSSVSGVSKKRDKALPPIYVDDNDPVALKRARNTAAARKSRARKVEERDGLEGRIAELEAQLAQSETEKAQLAGERDYWRAQAGGDTSE